MPRDGPGTERPACRRFDMPEWPAAAGIVILAVAYLASFLIVERIYQAGRDKLLSYRWLAWLMAAIETVRVKALTWVKASAAYQSAVRIRDEARRWLRGLRA
jgi:hypothetical protein